MTGMEPSTTGTALSKNETAANRSAMALSSSGSVPNTTVKALHRSGPLSTKGDCCYWNAAVHKSVRSSRKADCYLSAPEARKNGWSSAAGYCTKANLSEKAAHTSDPHSPDDCCCKTGRWSGRPSFRPLDPSPRMVGGPHGSRAELGLLRSCPG